jgi:hypothetical protein
MFAADALNCGSISSGDWAIPSHENQHYRATGIRLEWIYTFAIKSERSVLGGTQCRYERYQDEKQQKKSQPNLIELLGI